VFWGNEEFRTRQLVEQSVFTNGFTPLAAITGSGRSSSTRTS
jgi:hypothetical protein